MENLTVTTDASKEQSISFDLEKYRKLKREYKRALKEQKESFFFENKEILTGYAKYLLQYLSEKFEPK